MNEAACLPQKPLSNGGDRSFLFQIALWKASVSLHVFLAHPAFNRLF